MPTAQILRGAPAVISTTFLDQNGSARSASGVTATVTRYDGTAVTSGTAADGAAVGEKTITLTPVQTNQLDRLTVVWTEGNGAIMKTVVDVVGGYFFTMAEARDAGPNFGDPGKYADDLILRARRAVEEECEAICGRAFVSRFNSLNLNGDSSSHLWLPHPDVQKVTRLGVRTNGPTAYADAAGLAAVTFDASGRVLAPRGFFPWGMQNVEIGYEYGLDGPPQRIKTAALLRFRELMTWTKTGAPDSTTWQVIEGKVFGVPQPGVRGSKTGIPEVDQAYEQWTFTRGTAASVPYGRR